MSDYKCEDCGTAFDDGDLDLGGCPQCGYPVGADDRVNADADWAGGSAWQDGDDDIDGED